MKRCSKCGQEKPATKEFFHAKHGTKDGLCPTCKECRSESGKQYREKNREKLIAKSKEYYYDNQVRLTKHKREFRKNNKDHVLMLERQYRERHKDGVALRKKVFYQANKDRILAYLERYRNAPIHKEKARSYNKIYGRVNRERLRGPELIKRHRLMSIARGLTATFSLSEWNQCLEHFNHTCAYCGETGKKLAQEHFIARENGGGYERSNIVPACIFCNSSKSKKDFFEWYSLKPFYSEERLQKILEYLGLVAKEVSV